VEDLVIHLVALWVDTADLVRQVDLAQIHMEVQEVLWLDLVDLVIRLLALEGLMILLEDL
jgi:hypothetical protein